MQISDLFGRDPLQLWLLAALAVILLAALGRALWKWRRMRSRNDPLLVYPEDMLRNPMAPGPHGGLAWAPPGADVDDADDRPFRSAPLPEVSETATAGSTQRAMPSAPAAASHAVQPRPAASPPRPWPARPPAVAAAKPPVATYDADEASETIRLPTAADGTVQLLPGSLVVIEGPEVGREYRFLRVGSQPVPEVTIGRTSGPPYRHVQIAAATVSRMHARIRYEDGRWSISNLSTTNPLRVNGREVDVMVEVALEDGDRIQMGEVELNYRNARS